jgi:hypothetical protein
MGLFQSYFSQLSNVRAAPLSILVSVSSSFSK